MNGGNPNYNYSWSGPNSFTSINEDISNLFAGVYNLNIIDTNGCFYDTTITLSEPLEMVDSIYSPTFIGGNNISCNGISDGTIDAFITGGATPFVINWTGPNAFNSSSLNIVSLEAGVYYYTVSDANTCTLNDSIELTQPDSLQSILTSTLFPSGNNIACMGDTTGLVYTNVLGGNEGFTFNWSNAGSYSNIIQNPINMLADTYYLLLTDTNGCIWNDSIVLTEPNSTINGVITPSIFPSGDNISCFGTNDGNLSILANGGTPGYLYDWRGPNGYSNDSIFIDSLYAGVYDLVVTDSNGCSLSMSFTLEDPNSLLMLNDSVSTYPNGLNTSCFNVSDGSIELSPTGGSPSYSYNWTSDIGFNSSIEDISNISPGEYYIELIDTNGCVATDTFTLSQPDSMIINNLITPAICGNPIGSVNLFIEGSSPYSYLWSNGDTVSFVTNLSGGTYTAVITDMFGCIDSATYNIDDLSNQMSLDLYSPTFTGDHNISANNGSDGSIDMTILGGTPPFVIGWSNGSSTEDINNLQAGTHSATVTDANGCTTYATIELTEALPLEMPTAITPNGDGKNDFFFIRGLEVYPSNELTIFNRWGNIVFSQKDYQNDWDGTSDSGEALPEGTYFTILKIEYEGLELKGYIDIRR